jgi:hypothetical protein
MDPTDEWAGAKREKRAGLRHEPSGGTSGLERLLLVLAVPSAALVFLPPTAETALLHWNIIGTEHEFVSLLRKLGLWGCLACMGHRGFWKKSKRRAGIRPSFSAYS